MAVIFLLNGIGWPSTDDIGSVCLPPAPHYSQEVSSPEQGPGVMYLWIQVKDPLGQISKVFLIELLLGNECKKGCSPSFEGAKVHKKKKTVLFVYFCYCCKAAQRLYRLGCSMTFYGGLEQGLAACTGERVPN